MASYPALKAALPGRLKLALRSSFLRVSSILYAGSSVSCPCCGSSFRKFARFHGLNDQCPSCGSLMRQRAVTLYLRDVLRVPEKGGDTLHVGPASSVRGWLVSFPAVHYVSLDLDSPIADIKGDITDLPFPDDSYDLIVCLHVLEHVPEDRKAISELFRVLRPGGKAVIQVPPSPFEETLEDPTVTDPAERERRYGQYDHVRLCGSDYLAAAGRARLRSDARGLRGAAQPGDPLALRDSRRRAVLCVREAARVKRVSVIAPMWNEAAHIEGFVADIAAQDFDGEVELLVADGALDRRLGRAACAARPSARGSSSRFSTTRHAGSPPASTRASRAATGDLIVRVDCHSRYPTDYVRPLRGRGRGDRAPRTSAASSFRSAAPAPSARWPARWTARSAASTGRATARASASRSTPCPTGPSRPVAFERAGLFDETLVRNQDDEFNLRLRLAGGRIVLDPAIRIFYTPRGSFTRLFRQYYEYGLWKPAVMRKHGRIVSARSLVPIAFVGSLAVLLALAAFSGAARILLALELVVYGSPAPSSSACAPSARPERSGACCRA